MPRGFLVKRHEPIGAPPVDDAAYYQDPLDLRAAAGRKDAASTAAAAAATAATTTCARPVRHWPTPAAAGCHLVRQLHASG